MNVFLVLGIRQQTVSSFASCPTVRRRFCLNYRGKGSAKELTRLGMIIEYPLHHDTNLCLEKLSLDICAYILLKAITTSCHAAILSLILIH